MGGMMLVAVEKDGRIKWEPVNGIDSVASRDAKRREEREEARWVREMEASVKDARMQEARELARKEQQRKAELFGAENVYRTSRRRGPLVPVEPLLAQTREEEAAARKAGLDKSAPKTYQFIKESLDALEAQHAAKERAAREQAYERNRRRLRLGSSAAADDASDGGDGGSEDEVEDLRTRLNTMTDDEFKQLAMARKQRAEADLRPVETAATPLSDADSARSRDGNVRHKRAGKESGAKGELRGAPASEAGPEPKAEAKLENKRTSQPKLWRDPDATPSPRLDNGKEPARRTNQRKHKAHGGDTLDPKDDPDYRR